MLHTVFLAYLMVRHILNYDGCFLIFQDVHGVTNNISKRIY